MTDHHHPEELAPVEARIAAIEAVLVEKGVLDVDAVDQIVAHFEENLGPMNGAKVIAKAWTDPEYRTRLLTDGTAAIAELGFGGPEGEHVVVLENTADVHNLVVCTLCSCYPWPVLGLPPNWYKAPAYRSRAVREPRKVLAEMGTEIADDVEVRVWDSSAEARYLVLPMRPCGHRRVHRGAARGCRHARLHDRRAAAVTATPFDDESLPRDNGELVFEAPWQARALAIAVAVVDRLGLPWDAFRHRLMASIAEEPDRPYYESWTKALESLVVAEDLTTAAALDEAMPVERTPL